MDKNELKTELRTFFIEEKERETIEKLKLKHPELLAQVEKDAKTIEGLQQKVRELEDAIAPLKEEVQDKKEQARDERDRWLKNPDKEAQRKINYYTELRKRKGLIEEETETVPDEIIPEQNEEEYDEYRRQTLFGRLYGKWDDHYCEIVKCKSTDSIHRKQIENDGFILSSSVLNERKS